MRLAPLVAIALLVLVPILGVAYPIGDPPPLLTRSALPSIWESIAQVRLGSLFLRSLALSVIVALASLALGTWLAWLEQRCRYPGRSVLGILSLLPMAIPSYILAGTLRREFSAGGWSGGLVDLPPFTGLGAACLTLTLVCTPLVHLVVAAALARSSAAEEEAARSLGAGPWRIARTVWLARLRPAWALGLILVALYAVSDFGAVQVLDCHVLTWRLFQDAQHQRYVAVGVLGAALVLATVPLVVGARLLRGARRATTQVANPRPTPRHRLGVGGLLAAYLAHALIIGLGLLIPIAVLLSWIVNGQRSRGDSLLQAIPDSLQLAGLGTALTLLLALWAAWCAVHARRRREGALIEHGVYLTGALPGALLAAGLSFASLAVSRGAGDLLGLDRGGLYEFLGSAWVLLMIGYIIRFLPEAFGPLRNAISESDPRHADCARTLGAGRWRRARYLHAPALAPGLTAAAVLVGVAILKELPITLMLGTATGQRALSHYVYDRESDAFLADAGLGGILLVGIALVAVVASLRFRRHV